MCVNIQKHNIEDFFDKGPCSFAVKEQSNVTVKKPCSNPKLPELQY